MGIGKALVLLFGSYRLARAQTRHDLLGKKLDGAARLLEGEIAEGKAAGDIIHAGLIDLPLQLIARALRRATDHAAIRAFAVELGRVHDANGSRAVFKPQLHEACVPNPVPA